MKKLLCFVFVTFFFTLSAFAQTEGINFQGVARNAAGEVLVSQKISLRLSVVLGSESGAVAYVETRLATTNPQGVFAVVVGDGNVISKTGNFSSIDWKTASKFLKVEMDPNAGNNFLMMGTSRMQAVPFAFYAYGVDAENVKGILPLGSGGTGVASISELKTSLAVDQINNTSDASKPISTATQAALTTKVDKVTGKELSTNDYTTAEKTKLAAITGTNTGDQDLSAFATTSQLVTKANATDVTTSLATKANAADVTTSLATKVDKVTGKELSTNDYTTAEKTKLAAITGTNTGDQVNITGNAGTATLADNISATTNTTLTSLANLATVGTITSGTISLTTDIATTGNLKAGNNTYPNVLGSDGQFLKTNGSGTLSWASVPSPDLTNYVTTNTAQTITALKTFSETTTFSKDAIVNGITVGTGGGNVVNRNTAIGSGALSNNTNLGLNNTAIGSAALSSNTEGDDNTASGYRALRFNTTGRFNTASGSWALGGNQIGDYNTGFGINALTTNTTGSYNTAIGNAADVKFDNLTNATAIGNGAIVAASHTIQLGNAAVTDVKTSGAITASNYITSSDLRLKSNISPLANSLATVMQLNPVHYMKKSSLASTAYTREENGFIAQEIQKILPFIVKEGTDENKLLSVDYNSFIPMLTKAIQEQQKQIEEQNSKIAAQQKQIEELIKLVKGQ